MKLTVNNLLNTSQVPIGPKLVIIGTKIGRETSILISAFRIIVDGVMAFVKVQFRKIAVLVAILIPVIDTFGTVRCKQESIVTGEAIKTRSEAKSLQLARRRC